MVAALLGVVAGIAMLAYGNFGRPSTVEAATSGTLQIVAAPAPPDTLSFGPRSPVPTGIVSSPQPLPAASLDSPSVETSAAVDVTDAAPETPAPDAQVAADAASTGMTAHVPSDAANLG